MAQQMRNAPVYFVIAQVRFNPVSDLEVYAAKIQDRFRKEGFPDFSKEILTQFNLTVNAANASAQPSPVTPLVRYDFRDMNRTTGFILTQGALSLQTTEYVRSEKFIEDFLKGLQMIGEVVGGFAYSDRIGYRYLDAVFPRHGESLSDYLDSCLLGLTQKTLGTILQSFSESLIRIDTVNVIARAVLAPHDRVWFPPDLQPVTLALPERFQNMAGQHMVLDTDGYYEGRDAFSLETVKDRLRSLNREIRKAFEASVTPHALAVWN